MGATIGCVVSACQFQAGDRVRVRFLAPHPARPNRPVEPNEEPFGGREGTVIRTDQYHFWNAGSDVRHPAYTVDVRVDANAGNPQVVEIFREELLEPIYNDDES